jgi:integrase/recombinase XerD
MDLQNLKWQFLYESEVQPESRKLYDIALRKFFSWLNANHKDHDSICGKDIRLYKEYLINENHSPATCRTYFHVVRSFFRWASDKKLFKDIASEISLPKVKSGNKKKQLSYDQVVSLFESIDKTTVRGFRDFVIISLIFIEGFKPHAIRAINAGDIVSYDNWKGIFLKERNPRLYYHKIIKGSEGKFWRPFIDVRTHDVLEQLRELQQQRHQLIEDDSPLFTNTIGKRKGSRLSTGSMSKQIKRLLENAGLGNNYVCRSDDFHRQIVDGIVSKHLEYIIRGIMADHEINSK